MPKPRHSGSCLAGAVLTQSLLEIIMVATLNHLNVAPAVRNPPLALIFLRPADQLPTTLSVLQSSTQNWEGVSAAYSPFKNQYFVDHTYVKFLTVLRKARA